METCKKCKTYKKTFDDMMRQANDTLAANCHYCIMQRPVPEDIMKDKVKCPYFRPIKEK